MSITLNNKWNLFCCKRSIVIRKKEKKTIFTFLLNAASLARNTANPLIRLPVPIARLDSLDPFASGRG